MVGGLTFGGVAIGASPNIVAANACSNDSACVWQDTVEDDTITGDYRIQHGYALAYYGSYKDNQDRIHHDFRINNEGISRIKIGGEWEKTNHTESIEGHNVEVDANFASNILLTGDDASILGAMPTATGATGSIAATETVIKAAIGMLDPAMGFILTAAEVAEALEADSGSESGTTNTERHEWYYGNDGQPTDTSNHWEFFIMMEDNCDDTYFEVKTECYSYFAGTTYISTSYNVTNEDCGGLTSSSTTWMKVPEREIEESPRLQAIADGGPLWKAFLPIEVVDRSFEPQR